MCRPQSSEAAAPGDYPHLALALLVPKFMVLQQQLNRRTFCLGSSDIREQSVLPEEDLLFPVEAKTSRNGVWVGQARSKGDPPCPFPPWIASTQAAAFLDH